MSSTELEKRRSSLSPEKQELLARWTRGGAVGAPKSIPRRPESDVTACSPAQHRLWVVDALVPGSAAYLMPCAVRISGALDHAALAQSLSEIVRRHEVLRSVFEGGAGSPVQRVVNPEVSLLLVDLSGAQNPDERAVAYATEESRVPVDLTRGPLFRAVLYKLGENKHLLLVVFHHIACDGWSLGIFVRELAALYTELAADRASPLAELRLQYADYAHWQRLELDKDVFASDLDYWRERLKGASALQFPSARSRAVKQSYVGGQRKFEISSDLATMVRRFTQDEGTTLLVTLWAAFATLLQRYTDETDLVVGLPIANRDRVELENLIGFFTNTLPLRCDLSGDPTFRELVRRIKGALVDDMAHRHVPFEKIVEAVHPERDPSHNPLFQVMFVFNNTPMPKLAFGELSVELVDIYNGTAKFDLWLGMSETARGLSGVLEYNADLFDDGTAARLCGTFQTLLERLIANPDACIGDADILGSSDHVLLEACNRTAVDYPDLRLHDLLARQAARTPDAIAVEFEGMQLSYRDLDERANQLAHEIQRLPVAPDDRVCVCMERSVELVIALLAVLKSGAAYVPVDPTYPTDRIAFLIRDSGARIALTQHRFRDLVGASSLVIEVDAVAEQLLKNPSHPPSSLCRPDHLAYVIYTSGSTGQPKGAMIPHQGIVNRLFWMQDEYALTSDDRVLQKTPFTFDVSVWEFFWPLLAGACLVIARPEGHRDAAYLARVIRDQRITTCHFVPSMLRLFIDEGGMRECASLRRVICSGEALTPDLEQRFFSACSAQLHNLYGPTEASVDVTSWACQRSQPLGYVPIGRPIANTQIHIVDGKDRLVPVGVFGEICIGGRGVGRGYLNRPELTAERFVPDPFKGSGEERPVMFKTGDIARWCPSGEIEFLGRRDFQVKIRGLRIELGEIEATLQQHADVKQAVVNVYTDSDGSKRLAAYVVPAEQVVDEALGETKRTGQIAGDRVSAWRRVFDEEYKSPKVGHSPTQNFVSWKSSYTGAALPDADMREWRSTTLARLDAIPGDRVLELGCGTGILLFAVAPRCRSYVATDVASEAIVYIQCHRALLGPAADHVKFLHAAAHDAVAQADGPFDVIVLNSVVQYFPSLEYLLDVLKGCENLLPDGGHVFLGDVRSLPLLEAFYAGVALAHADDDDTLDAVYARSRALAAQERELVVAPALFTALERTSRMRCVYASPRRGVCDNELTRFRYDVLLKVLPLGQRSSVGTPEAAALASELPPLVRAVDLDTVRASLREVDSLALRVKNRRVSFDLELLDQLRRVESSSRLRMPLAGELRSALVSDEGNSDAVDPELLFRLGEETGFDVSLGWAEDSGELRVAFRRLGCAQVESEPSLGALDGSRPLEQYANRPLDPQIGRELTTALRQHLKQTLPGYMMPNSFTILRALPFTSSGKLDRNSLPAPAAPSVEASREYVAPGTDLECELAEIWAEVLGIERIGIYDNFFELGGDSIQCIQAVARATDRGLVLEARDMFVNQTIVDLASMIAMGAKTQPIASQGPWPVTSFQETLLRKGTVGSSVAHRLARVSLPRAIGIAELKAVLGELIGKHEALRLRFQREEGTWTQSVAQQSEREVVVVRSEQCDGSHDARREIEARAVSSAVSCFDLLKSAPVVAVYIDSELNPEMLLAGAAAALDGPSLDLLAAEAARVVMGHTGRRTPSACTLGHWVDSRRRSLLEPADQQRLSDALKALHSASWQVSASWRPSPNSVEARVSAQRLTAEVTASLVGAASRNFHATLTELIVTSLTRTLASELGHSGSVVVDMEVNERACRDGLPLEAMLGPFAERIPIAFTFTPAEDVGTALKQLKETLRRWPGLELALASQTGLLSDMGEAGRLGHAAIGLVIDQPIGKAVFSTDQEPALIVQAQLLDGLLTLSWASAVAEPAWLERMCAAHRVEVETVASYCSSEGETGATPSDFPLAALDQTQIDGLVARGVLVEDAYEPSPLQAHMLARHGSDFVPGLYVVQRVVHVRGEGNVEVARSAWQKVVDTHTLLRTSLHSEFARPLQIVHAIAEAEFRHCDLRSVVVHDRESAFEAIVRADRERGFDPADPHPMRLSVAQFGDEDFRILMSCHYMRLDGWSLNIVLEEFFAGYIAAVSGVRPSEPVERRPYTSYLRWLRAKERSPSDEYWRQLLAGFQRPTPVLRRLGREGLPTESVFTRRHLYLTELESERLRKAAKRLHLTINTVAQGAWALLLASFTGETDLLFGFMVSGRPASLPGVEAIVGAFTNVLPLRVRVDPKANVAEWLATIRKQTIEMTEHEHTPIARIASLSELDPGHALFESYMAFQNLPRLATSMADAGLDAAVVPAEKFLAQMEHPLRIDVFPAARIALVASFYLRWFDGERIDEVLDAYRSVLLALSDPRPKSIAEVLETSSRPNTVAKPKSLAVVDSLF